MPNIQIVTDSCAHFTTPHFLHQHPMVTVVPNRITIAGKTYREGVDLSPEEALRTIAYQPYAPTVASPTEADYIEVYNRLSRNCDAIISIHATRELFTSYNAALSASRQFAGNCPIAVIDSQSLCAGQGMLTGMAAKAVQRSSDMDSIVRKIRSAVDRLYSLYYVENVSYLMQNKIMSPSHSILSGVFSIKPFLSVEHGRLMLVEKVRARGQAIDRLFEFVAEFADIEEVVILHNKAYINEQARVLQERLSVEFPGHYFPHSVYGASLAALIGTDATGVVILEEETETTAHDL